MTVPFMIFVFWTFKMRAHFVYFSFYDGKIWVFEFTRVQLVHLCTRVSRNTYFERLCLHSGEIWAAKSRIHLISSSMTRTICNLKKNSYFFINFVSLIRFAYFVPVYLILISLRTIKEIFVGYFRYSQSLQH